MPNPFDTALAARCYAEGRPDYHDRVIELLRKRVTAPLPRTLAVDVGCGTGQSSRALRAVARDVLGLDSSRHMLAHAVAAPGVRYAQATAEALPVRSASAALLTCGAAYHWFARDAFLREIRRVLIPDGLAVIYDNFFTAVSRGSGEFAAWYRNAFLERFPKPPRHATFSPGPAEQAGLAIRGSESYEHDASMTLESLGSYLLTQSNVQAALTANPGTFPQVESWLREELRRFFPEQGEATFGFGGDIWFLGS